MGTPTGTGVYHPFLRYQDNPFETGLNTDYKPVPYDDKMPVDLYTHSVRFDDLLTVNLGTIADPKWYYGFTIDFNEPGSHKAKYLSFDNYDLYEGNAPDLFDVDTSVAANDMKLKFNSLDTILTDYTLQALAVAKMTFNFSFHTLRRMPDIRTCISILQVVFMDLTRKSLSNHINMKPQMVLRRSVRNLVPTIFHPRSLNLHRCCFLVLDY